MSDGSEWGGRRGTGARRGSERPPKLSPAERRERRAAETDPAVVLASAVRALEARQLSVSELQRKLHRLGYPGELIEGAVTRLVELGYLDDDAFARAWVDSRDRARPRGERALRSELGRKGVERSVVDAVLGDRRETAGPGDEGSGPSPDEVAAIRLIARHAAALARVPDPRARRQRAYGLLARNGFDPDIASRISRTVDVAAAEESLEDD